MRGTGLIVYFSSTSLFNKKMISIFESVWSIPQIDPSQDDLDKYGITKDQYNEWRTQNPEGFIRRGERVLYSPGFSTAMSFANYASGNDVRAMRWAMRSSKYSVNRTNRRFINSDLAAARKFYDSNSAAAKN